MIACCCCWVTKSCPTICDPGTAAYQASQSFTISQFAQIHVQRVNDAIQPSHPLLPPSPLTLNLYQHRVFPISRLFASGGQSIGTSASASVLPVNEYSGLISFRIDCFDFLALQGTLKSLLQHHSSKASILWCSAIFMVQLPQSYMTTGKIIVTTF